MIRPKARSPVFSSGDASDDWFEPLPGERMRIRIDSSASGGQITLLENIISPGAAAPRHFHEAANELFIVLEGSILLCIGDEQVEAGSGAALFVPSGASHAFVNTGNVDARVLGVFLPGGMEAMFREAARTRPEAIEAMAARHATVVLPPVMVQ